MSWLRVQKRAIEIEHWSIGHAPPVKRYGADCNAIATIIVRPDQDLHAVTIWLTAALWQILSR